jgi:hypothetical protein
VPESPNNLQIWYRTEIRAGGGDEPYIGAACTVTKPPLPARSTSLAVGLRCKRQYAHDVRINLCANCCRGGRWRKFPKGKEE